MKSVSTYNRRDFLRTAAVATVALAAGDQSQAEAATGIAPPALAVLVDVNVSLGRWPTRRLPLDETSALVSKLRKLQITQAWAGNFEAAFGRDLNGANAWLARECQRRGRGLLVPFGTVDLKQTDWREELQRCHEQHRMRGLRLFPSFHGYTLSDPAFLELLSLAHELKMVVQIVVSLEDERTQPTDAQVPAVDVKPLTKLLAEKPAPAIMLLNWHRAVKPETAKVLAKLGVGFDIATVENVGGVGTLAENIGSSNVYFGSHAPFFYPEAAGLKLQESVMETEALRRIGHENARRLLK